MPQRHFPSILRVMIPAFLLCLAFATTASAQNEYLVMEQGDQATFQGSSSGQEVNSSVSATSGHWRRVSQLAGLGPVWLWPSRVSQRSWIYAGSGIQSFADFSAVGSSQTVDIGGAQGTVTVAALGETVVVPAGSFTRCVRLELQGFSVERAWFEKGVGCVKWVTRSGERFELIRASVGGTTYPTGGMDVSAVIPVGAVVDAKPPLPARIPTVTIRASLTNRTGAAVSVPMQVGRPTIRVTITDLRGNVITEQQPMIRAAIFLVDLAPGVTAHTSLLVRLIDETQTGRPAIPAGDYRVRVTVGTDWSAEGPLHVVWGR